MLKVLVVGACGQLGSELKLTCPANIKLLALTAKELDITDAPAVAAQIQRFAPNVVINAAAYTAVDKAESDEDLAFAVNTEGVKYLAEACKKQHARFIHISTDFVFNGEKSSPYTAQDETQPLGVYGHSKLVGEMWAQKGMGTNYVIIRTAWVYSSHGSNFVKTMLRLANTKPSINVVADQVGTPTWAKGLARAIWHIIDKPEIHGLFNWTDAGVCSWYDFALSAIELAAELGMTKSVPVFPIRTCDYPTPAKRPAYSVLDKTELWEALGYKANHWRHELKEMLLELKSIEKGES